MCVCVCFGSNPIRRKRPFSPPMAESYPSPQTMQARTRPQNVREREGVKEREVERAASFRRMYILRPREEKQKKRRNYNGSAPTEIRFRGCLPVYCIGMKNEMTRQYPVSRLLILFLSSPGIWLVIKRRKPEKKKKNKTMIAIEKKLQRSLMIYRRADFTVHVLLEFFCPACRVYRASTDRPVFFSAKVCKVGKVDGSYAKGMGWGFGVVCERQKTDWRREKTSLRTGSWG